jgi:hypothetical protein
MLRESDKTTRYRIPLSPNHCSHKFADIDAVVVRLKDMGFAAQCLLCDTVGPERTNPEAARRALTDTRRRKEDDHFPGAS